ncbi:hypothetical protein SAMN05444156_2637 [Verrucomicrobium sp. GAS474]|uniref:thioredoxin domain-containing protein n=1 Tax=Verrucomicrobium sp. GAS474 TaxID=1882831 RepID=UPI00087BAF5B|nr:thioredoxin domain-containing protein [Verrucomicrobium sp. GAS474]SDU21265.1 hypothetical protein SAMN05444156_2637 [Verrucomicrobium sp. GAS474]
MNALAHEKSPYLLQHAENPVEWLPWGPAAFAKARAEQKPIFLSIGYSTCHWCHVMAHESFENEATARLLNDGFIPVKLDREERPDVDRLYMAYVQSATGHGGWPMSVWLTPDLKPFYGGTYFAPDSRYGRPGFPDLLRRIAQLWKTERDGIVAQSERFFASLAESAEVPSDGTALQPKVILADGFDTFRSRFDGREGGFGQAPKFPRPAIFDFLFRHAARLRRENASTARAALDMALFTLDKMAAGGMRDHLGGGFHRYSVDTFWHVPHFEKMLYDQAQLALAYTEAFRITGEERHAVVVRETLDYLLDEMAHPEGGFHSAEDADSLPEGSAPGGHKVEGAYYVWTDEEIVRHLGADVPLFAYVYGVEKGGNTPPGSDPHGEFVGQNVLIRRHSSAAAAARFSRSEVEVEIALAAARRTLRAIRSKRPLPHRDDKILTAWNGLALSALAVAAQALGELEPEPRYRAAAERTADFLLTRLRQPGTGRLLRAYREGPGTVEGFAEDYACLIAGLLDLYEATFENRWLSEAAALQKQMEALFWDPAAGGYFASAGDDPSLLLRMKEEYDGAEPAANSVAAGNLLRLHRLLGDEAYRERAEAIFRASRRILERAPEAAPRLMAALEEALSPALHLVIVGPSETGDEGTRALLREARRLFLPQRTLLRFVPGEPIPEVFGRQAPFYASLRSLDGKPTAFLCEDFACRLPTSDPVVLRNMLEKHSHSSTEVI